MPLEPGTHLGPYKIVDLLGVGGMGEVYRARDDRLNRLVALKVLSGEREASPERRGRFIQEAQLASALQHPNIVTVFDIGSAEGNDYLAMELVRGRTLDMVIPPAGLPLQQALRYATQIVDALAAAHTAGIVHRDLKPGNIMVTDQDQIKVLDFGLATLSATFNASDETGARAAAIETGAGTILGTVAYMSPEQAEGHEVDARSDIFSFGAIFYEMLSGLRAFRAASTFGTLAAVLNQEPEPLAKVARHVPPAVDQIVIECLRKEPARRAQSASTLTVQLEGLREASISGVHAPVPPGAFTGATRRLVIGAGVLAVAIAAFLLWPSKPLPASFTPAPLTALPGSETFPSFSPDGSRVAFTWLREGGLGYDIFTQAGAAGTPKQLTDDGNGHMYPAWSPDGTTIAAWHVPRGISLTAVTTNIRVRLVLLPAQGGDERQILEWEGAARRLSWSPDGRWLALSPVTVRTYRERGITLVATDTGAQIDWTALEPAFAASENPIFSPDGRRLAFTKMRDDFSADVYVAEVDADGRPAGPPTQLAYGGRETSLPIWTADGRTLLVIDGVPSSNGGVRRVPLDGSPASAPLGGLEHPGSIALDRSGTRLAFHRPGLDVDIWRLDLQNLGASGRVAPSTLWEEGGDISADGTRLAFASNRSGPREIWVADVSGDRALQLTRFGGPVPGSPRWSPDQKWIAFDARPDGNSDVFVVAAAGGPIRQLTKERSEDARPVWSRDGKSLFFASSRSGRSEIWKMPAEGGQAVQVTRQGASNVTMSWDGQWIFYQGVTAPLAIRRARLDGSDETLVVDEDVRIGMLTATEHGLWYVVNPVVGRSAVTLKVLNLADGTRREAATVDFVPIPVGLSVSGDERYATITRNDRNGADLLVVNGFR